MANLAVPILCVAVVVLVNISTLANSEKVRLMSHRQPQNSSRQAEFDPFNCEGVRSRKELRALSDTEITDWQNAILELINERNTVALGFWDYMVGIHKNFSAEAHGGSYFLPWHRLFLLRLENEIRNRGRPDFALPYWDWSVDANDAALSTIWGQAFVGGAKSAPPFKSGKPIPDGPFKGITAIYNKPHRVLRNFSSGISGSLLQLLSPDELSVIINADTFETFSISTEVSHGIVHVAIGGDMRSVKTSPNDPIFYLHHAFVDFIYSRRQAVAGTDDFGGVHFFPRRSKKASPEYIFKAFQLSARDGFDTPCVQYVPYSADVAPAPRQPEFFAPTPLVSPSPPGTSVLEQACHDPAIRLQIPVDNCMNAMNDL